MAGLDFSDSGKQGSGDRKAPASQSFASTVEKFRDAIAARGLGRPEIVASGRIERFKLPEDDGNETTGWYIFHTDGVPSGAFGSWREGEENFTSWCSKAKYEMTVDEQRAYQAWINGVKESKREQREREFALCKEKANKLWESASEIVESEYLKRKGIEAVNCRMLNGTILVPLYDFDLNIVSLQRIAQDGTKKFLKSTIRKDTVGLIDPKEDMDTVFVCEGWATGVSIHMATGCAVVLAFNADSLADAVKFAKDKCPSSKIIIAGDNDAQSKKADGTLFNVGLEKAHKAAEQYGVKYVIPQFKNPQKDHTDFNDLATAEGLEVVSEQLQPKAVTMSTMNVLMNMHIRVDPIADGLFDAGESLLIIGPSNVGKTIFILNMALALASPVKRQTNKDFNEQPKLFGKFPIVEQQEVLILQSENNSASIQARLQKMTDGNPAYKEAVNHIHVPLYKDNNCRVHGNINGDFRDDVRAFVKKCGAKILILDPLVSFHSSDENDNVKMRYELDGFSDLAKELGVTLVIVHHTGKNNTAARGASAIRDWCDNALILEPCFDNEKKTVISVTHDKSRNHPIMSKFYLERTRNLTLELLGDPGLPTLVEAIKAQGGSVQGEKAMLEAYNEVSGTEVTRYSLRRRIKKAIDAGLICRDGRGRDVFFTLGPKAEVCDCAKS